MKQKIGKTFMLLGLLMLLGGVFLLMYNHTQAMAAEQASVQILPQIAEKIEKSSVEDDFGISVNNAKAQDVDFGGVAAQQKE